MLPIYHQPLKIAVIRVNNKFLVEHNTIEAIESELIKPDAKL